MANRVPAPNLFAPSPPNWSLQLLDANATNATGAINDSSLGSVNGPLTDTGTVNAYAVTCAFGSPSAYNVGMTVFFTPANANTGPSTLTVSPLSSAPIVNADGTALAAGAIVAGSITGVCYDGASFRIFNSVSPAVITSVRLRSFNAVGNCSFEVDQRNCGNQVANISNGAFWQDRWQVQTVGTMRANATRETNNGLAIPGTSFFITANQAAINATTAEASLATGDYFFYQQSIEGSVWRELANDVFSLTLLVHCNVANFKFAVSIRDSTSANSIVNLCTIPTASTWTLIQLPNLPHPTTGTFPVLPGQIGCSIAICLASGTTFTAPSTGTWVSGNYVGASGMNNLFSATGQVFRIGAIQLEPGPVCSQLMDLDFATNLTRCQRYFSKSYGYATKPGMTNTFSYATTTCPLTSISGAFSAYGYVPFPVEMAKQPTITSFDPTTGSANNLFYRFPTGVSGSIALTSANATSHAISSVNSSGSGTGPLQVYFEYTADTGF